jgi:tagaturonate reductase
VNGENIFCSTLVDRIVTGGAKAEAPALWEKWGYEDQLIDTGEVFAAWVIEGPQSIRDEFPFEKAGLPIQVVDDVTPYKQRKVRILNGAHTSMVLGAYLAGKNIVRDCMRDESIRAFLNKAMFEEIIPTLDLPKEELEGFAASVIDRFDNPYIDHQLLDIALNSASKWKARVMPSVTEYVKRTGKLPRCLTFSFAAFIAFYHKGERDGVPYEVSDDAWVLDFFREHNGDDCKALAHAVVNFDQLWDGMLAELPGFEEAVAADLERIEAVGMYEAMKECLQ